jgi:cell division protein FtsQ
VLVAGAVVVALAVGGLMLARKSSMFAVRSIEVRGAPPAVSARIRATLERWRGTSLVGLDGRELVQSLDALPLVASASLDRDFPHTLRVRVAPERAVAVLRRGLQAWLVSARGRVLHRAALRSSPQLPRIWVPTVTPVAIGQVLPARGGGAVARALAPVAHDGFPVKIASAVLAHGELVLGLSSHVQIRMGEPDDILLKLAIARRVVRELPSGTSYLDVSVPERPVSGPPETTPPPVSPNPQVSG